MDRVDVDEWQGWLDLKNAYTEGRNEVARERQASQRTRQRTQEAARRMLARGDG